MSKIPGLTVDTAGLTPGLGVVVKKNASSISLVSVSGCRGKRGATSWSVSEMSSKLAKRSLDPKGGLWVLKLKVLFLVVKGLGVVLLEMMGTKPNSNLGVVFFVGLVLKWIRLLVEADGRGVVMKRGPGRPPRGLTFKPWALSESERKNHDYNDRFTYSYERME